MNEWMNKWIELDIFFIFFCMNEFERDRFTILNELNETDYEKRYWELLYFNRMNE